MTDVVSVAIADIISRIRTINAVKKQAVYIYEQDELLNTETKLGYPAVGVMYAGLQGKTDSSKTGLAADITIDIFLIGGDLCDAKMFAKDELKPTSTSLLADIRDAIKCRPHEPTYAQRKWKFVFEVPADFSKDVLGYAQRWTTTILLSGD